MPVSPHPLDFYDYDLSVSIQYQICGHLTKSQIQHATEPRRRSGSPSLRLDCNATCSQSISELARLFPFYRTSKAEKSNGDDNVDESDGFDGFEESEQTGDRVLLLSQKLPHEGFAVKGKTELIHKRQ
ncbi:hypothetical protein F2Q68_00045613 [Brassica cretica]|uniref:Uncharacterized protein n=1 Tax=Brassica cretica TaxID=69181 RepID=A0A8S9LLC9_BRACR|nr:hypothetical protein F2Q68_00045613 [Brassica cretica]